MSTDAFTDRLSDYLDDELSTDDRAAITSHLRECASCRTTLDELRGVISEATALTSSAPERDLWSGIATRIGHGSEGRAFVSAFRRVISSRLSFTLPQLAAAALALMVLSGGLVWMARSGDPRADFSPISAADPDRYYHDAVADLQRRFDAGRTSLDDDTVRVLQENLDAIDRAADECRRALDEDPKNLYLHTHLADTRQSKLMLLRRAAALVAGS